MRAHKIPHTDLTVSRIAYGCATLGLGKMPIDPDVPAMIRWMKAPLDSDTTAKAVRLINTAYDNGITLYDHADSYGFGKSEAAFGEVLKQSAGLRHKIVIQTKCGIRFQDEPQEGDPHRMDFSGEHIVGCAEGSLRRLNTDHLEILLLHIPDALVEPEEVAQAFDRLQSSGKVRYFGVSNHTAGQIELLKKYVRQPLVVNQIHVSLAHSYLVTDGIEANRDDSMRMTHGYTGVAGTLDYCRLHDIQVQAYSPLRGGNIVAPPSLLNVSADVTPQVKQAAQLVADLAHKKNVKPSAIALAWLLRHPAGIVPIIGTSNPDRVIESCAADRVTLSREEWYTLLASSLGIPPLQLLGVSLDKTS